MKLNNKFILFFVVISSLIFSSNFLFAQSEDLDVSFTSSCINASSSTTETIYLFSNPLVYSPCKVVNGGIIKGKVHMGDDYNIGSGNMVSNTSFDQDVSLTITGYSSFSGTSGSLFSETINCNINNDEPEEIFKKDVSSYLSQGLVRITITIPASISNGLNGLDTYFAIDVTANKTYTYTPLISPTSGVSSLTETQQGTYVKFEWSTSYGCNYPAYEFQLLRLYNTDITYAATPQTITAVVNWDEALSLIVENEKEITLAMPEGKGSYAWRVRAIGNQYTEYGNSDPRNWGEWSSHLAQSSINASGDYIAYYIDATTANNTFYYNDANQLPDDKNWIYTRSFVEGDQEEGDALNISEGVNYFNYLNMPEQQLLHLNTNDNVIATQTVYDYTGRPALTSLPAPVCTTATLEYQNSILKDDSNVKYSAENFDANSTYNNPDPIDMDYSIVSEYYSSASSEDWIADAGDYPFIRTIYYTDGTGRAKEVSGAGSTLKPGSTHTTKTYYAIASEGELIYLFGDEAPSDGTTYKQMIKDPNGVISISYVNMFGQTIASCYSNNEVSNMEDITSTSSNISYTVTDVIDDFTITNNEACASRTYAFPEGVNKLDLSFELTPATYGEECANFCYTCDYLVDIQLLDKATPSTPTTVLCTTLVPTSQTCGSESVTVFSPTTIDLTNSNQISGEYILSVCIYTNNVDASAQYPNSLNTYLENNQTSIYEDIIQTFMSNTNNSHLMNHLDNNELSDFFDDLDDYYGNGTGDPDDIIYIPVDDNTGCDSIEIHYTPCVEDPSCNSNDPGFEDFFCDYWYNENGSYPCTTCNSTSGSYDFLWYGNPSSPSYYQKGDFDDMISNLMDDGGYACANIWECWEAATYSYEALKETNDGLGATNLEPNLVEIFIDCVKGKETDSDTLYENYYSTNSTNLRDYPYLYFYYDGQNTALEDLIDEQIGNNNGSIDNDKERTWLQRGSGELPSYISVSSNSDAAEILYELEQKCDSMCFARFPDFLDKTAELFLDECYNVETYGNCDCATVLGTVSLADLNCYAWTMVEHLRDSCDLDIDYTFDGSGYVSGVNNMGDEVNIEAIQRILLYDYDIQLTSSGSCSSGYDNTATNVADFSAQEVMLHYMNDQLNRTRSDLGLTSEDYRFKDFIYNFIDGETSYTNLYQCGYNTTLLETTITLTPNKYSKFAYDCDYNNITETSQVILDNNSDTIGTLYFWHPQCIGLGPFDVCYRFESAASSDLYVSIDFSNNVQGGTVYSNIDGEDYGDIYFKIPAGTSITNCVTLRLNNGQSPTSISVTVDEIQNASKSTITLYTTYSLNFSPGDQCPCCTLNYVYETNTVASTVTPFPNTHPNFSITNYTTSEQEVCDEVCDTRLEPCGLCFKWVKPSSVTSETISILSCEEENCMDIKSSIWAQLSEIAEQMADNLADSYRTNCILGIEDAVDASVEYDLGYEQFTLYYYDRAGNLVKTIPPEGVTTGTTSRVHVNHTMATEYEYNSLGQLIRQKTPDGGETFFKYNNDGQLRFSQNEEQEYNNQYSYTKYDDLGRVIESGQYSETGASPYIFYEDQAHAKVNDNTWPSSSDPIEMVTTSVYTTPSGITYYNNLEQEYLLNRISSSTYDTDGDNTTTYDRVTYNYSYDPHGNVSWVVMEHPQIGNQYLRYEYDLLSGNVKKVCYNEYESDRFFHKYNYDADGRILYAQTSINNYVWEKDATYNYYDHGPLKRTVIGEDKVQGMDYIYTIQGWLKAINDPLLNITADPSQDGSTTTSVAKDAFAMALSYYTNDFTNNQILTGAGDLSPQYPLYNGNIAAWTTNHQAELGTSSNKFIQLTAYQYKYDKLNRIRNADFKIYTSAWGDPTIGTGSQFDALFVYDRNGNIDALKRNAHSEGPNQTEINPLMDDFSYHYESQTNKLINLDDAVTTSNFQDVDIIDFNPTTGDNYQYDRIGNLIVDQSENIDNIEWNAQGKIEVIEKQIDDGGTMIDQEIHFYYDPLGNRIRKEVRYPSNQINNTTTFYVRDLQGNIMCTYTREDSEASPTGYVATYSVDEYPIYGSDRLGVYRADESNILFQIEYPDFNHLPEYQNTSNNTTPTYNIGRLALSSIKYNNFTSPTSYRQAQIPSSAIEHISNTSSTQQSLNNSIIHCNNLAICSDYDGNVLAMASNVSNMNGSKNANALIITDAQGIPYASTANIKSDPNSQNLFVKTPGMDTYYLFTIGSDTKAYYHIIDPINKIVLQKNICIDSLSGYSYSIAAIMDEAGNGKSKLFLKRFSNDTTHLYTFNFNHNGITFKQHIDAIPSNDADLSAPLTLSANAQSLALVVNKSKPRFLFRSAKSTELRIYDISTNHDTVSFNDSIQFSNYYISSLAFSQKNHYLYFQKNDMQGNADLYRYSISAQSSEAITSVSAQGKMMYSDSLIYIMDNDNIEALAYTDTSSIANLQRSSITPPNTYRYSGFSASTTINILNAALYDPTSATNFDRVTDYKLYELKDHLGNVRVVISDIKEPTDANFNQFTADLQSYYNYYPFGMLQPKRHYTLAEEYKFGFNGMEMDNEVEGNTGSMYSTTFRELDVRLGRWWGTDPIEHPFQSPYCTFDNNPVIIYDPSGADGGGDKETGEVTATVYFQWDPEEDHTGDNLDNYIHNFANNVRQNWNNYTLDNGQQVSVDNVQFLPAPDGMTEDDLDKNENLLTVGNGASASDNSIPGVSYINKNFRRNTGYMYFSMNGSDASHEFGHMLGLSDRYFEGFAIDKNGGLYSQRITMPNKFKQNGYDCQTNLMSNPNPVLTTLNSKQLNIAFNRNRKEWKHQRVALIHSGARSYNSASFFLGKVRYFNGDNRVSGSGWWYHQLYKKRFKKSTPQKANRVTVNTNNLWP